MTINLVFNWQMCSKSPLFNRDNEDNVVAKEQHRLVNWQGLHDDERDAVLCDCKEVPTPPPTPVSCCAQH